MADSENYIDINKIAELKGLKSNRSLRIEINKSDSKYISRKTKTKGGYTYEILFSSLEPEIQEKLLDEEIKSKSLVPINIYNNENEEQKLEFKTEKLKLEALAKIDLIKSFEDFSIRFDKQKEAKENFIALYNSGEYFKDIFKILGKISYSSLYRWSVIYQQNNRIEDIASGEYIFFLDPDDWIDDNTFEILINKFKENKDTQIVQFEYLSYNENTQKNRKSNFVKTARKSLGINLKDNDIFSWKDFKTPNFKGFYLSIWNKMYSAKFIKENNILLAPNKHGEDHIFSIKSIMLADKILYIQNYLYHYRVRIGSSVNKASKDNICIFENIEYLRQFLIEQNLFVELEEQFNNYKTEVLGWHYCCMPKEDVKEYLEKCKNILTTDEYNKFIKRINGNFSLLEKIFALKNKKIHGVKYKIVKILWFEFIFEPKSKRRTQ